MGQHLLDPLGSKSMSRAEKASLAPLPNGGMAKLAKQIDPEVQFDEEDRTYHFSDGSVLGTKGKGRHFQRWVIGKGP